MRQYNLGLGLALPNCFFTHHGTQDVWSVLISGLVGQRHLQYDGWVRQPATCKLQNVGYCRIQEQNTLWCPSCCIPGRSSDVCEIPEVCSRTAPQFLVINYRVHHGFIMDCQMDLRWIVSAIQCLCWDTIWICRSGPIGPIGLGKVTIWPILAHSGREMSGGKIKWYETKWHNDIQKSFVNLCGKNAKFLIAK